MQISTVTPVVDDDNARKLVKAMSCHKANDNIFKETLCGLVAQGAEENQRR